MYSLLVLRCGIAPDYVMDKMPFYEMDCLIENMWMKDKESWEQTRALGYITAQCQNNKQLDPKKILPLSWDTDNEKETSNEVSKEEREEIFRQMKAMGDQINNKNNNQ